MTQIGGFPAGLAAGQPENVADVVTGLTQIKTVVNGQLQTDNLAANAGIVGTQLASGAAITDQQLASSNLGVYKRLLVASGYTNGAGLGAGTYFFQQGISLGVSGSTNILTAPGALSMIYLAAADYAVTGKTTRLRIRASTTCNTTAPGITFTFGLYPFTVGGGAGILTPTLGTVLAGSTVAIASPVAAAVTTAAATDTTASADGGYMLGVVLSGAPAANNVTSMVATLDVRNT